MLDTSNYAIPMPVYVDDKQNDVAAFNIHIKHVNEYNTFCKKLKRTPTLAEAEAWLADMGSE